MAGKVGVGAAQRGGHGVGALRHGDQVNVLGHEAVSPEAQRSVVGVVPQEVEIEAIVLGIEEDLLALVSALGDVVRKIFKDNPGDSRHRRYSGGRRTLSQGWCLSVLSRLPL